MRQRFTVLMLTLLLTACGGAAQTTPTPAANNAPETAATLAPATTSVGAEEPTAVPPTEPAEEAAPTEPAPTEVPAEAAPEEATATVRTEETPTAETEPTAEPTPEPEPTSEPEPTPEAVAPAPFDLSAISVSLELVNGNFAQPVAVTHAGDGSGRLFVVEKGGRIWVVEGTDALDTPFLNIGGSVSDGYEQGLLGLAFEPGRPERFYVNYTDLRGNTIIARYRVGSDPSVADAASAEVILTIQQPAANHNGGHLAFGPDGYLWIGMGDGGGAGDRFGNGQNPNTLLGKMLRLDVSGETGYAPAPGNPAASGAAWPPEVWAIGLRNPWRYSFDRATGDLWLADVGQNAWEEVNHVGANQAGLNYGWPLLEATHCFSQANCSPDGFVLPVTEYSHGLGVSITGGHVYRGAAFPNLQGGYFFADFATGIMWALPADTQSFVEPTIVLQSGEQISSFGEDEAGELYVTAFDGGLYRLVSQ